MKRSWSSILLVAGVIGLLTLFLGLQYNWQSQASAAERERMQKRVEADARKFADDFNREIQAAYFNFQADASTWKNGDFAEFNERFDYWKSKTQYPRLIREFVFFGKDGLALRYNFEKRMFVSAEVSEEILSLRSLIENEKSYMPFYEDKYALVMPIHEDEKLLEKIVIRRSKEGEPPKVHLPEKYGNLMILLDRPTAAGILTDLAAKYFGGNDFKAEIVNEAGEPLAGSAKGVEGVDAKAKLLDLSPDSMIYFGDRAIFSRMREEKRPGVVVDQLVESRTFSHSETRPDGTKTGTFKIELQPGKDNSSGGETKTRTSVITSSTAGKEPWTLNVQHTSGSIDAFIRWENTKSYLIGLGVYLLLVGSIITIVLSAARSRRFAQRQIDFVSSVSHEFRTPLAVIYSAGENLADGVAKDESQVERYGNLIKGEGKKLSAMVEQILEFAGARSGRRQYNFAPANVGEIAAKAIAECEPLLEKKDFELERRISSDLPIIDADAEALSRAIQNLIQNAAKYSNGSKWIRVVAENGGGRIKISVEDRGIGIKGNEIGPIFEPFYRAKEVVDAQIHGNGLGLSLVKEIAEAHGGKVLVESESGKGSKFTIELPAADK